MAARTDKQPPTDPWPLQVRVHGGRINHLARMRTATQSIFLELACGATALVHDLDNDLRDSVCRRCRERADRDRDPAGALAAAAEQRARQKIAQGQHPLWP